MSNYEIYKNILEKEIEAFNGNYYKLENEISNKKKEIHTTEINEFLKLCNLSIELSKLKDKLNKIQHLTTEHFVYSSLEAFKNIINPTTSRYGYIILYAFPHNTETNVKYIDDRLVDLFEIAFNDYINSSMDLFDKKVYKSVIIEY